MRNIKRVVNSTLTILAVAATVSGAPDRATAGSSPYIGDIVAVGENFCPLNWMSAEGQILPIANYTALFSLIGNYYGGDGRATFGLPNLMGRVAVGQGRGPGLTMRTMGNIFGAEKRVLTAAQMPQHSHDVFANNLDGNKAGPGGKLLAAAPANGVGSETIYSTLGVTRQMSPEMIENTGASDPFNVQDPYLVMQYCIAVQGIYPSRP